jgi:hypothetical protein
VTDKVDNETGRMVDEVARGGKDAVKANVNC